MKPGCHATNQAAKPIAGNAFQAVVLGEGAESPVENPVKRG